MATLNQETWNDAGQASDDLDLLDAMMTAAAASPSIYQTKNYWKRYEKQLIPYLRKTGLQNFRRARGRNGAKVLASFGARDLIPTDFPPQPQSKMRLKLESALQEILGIHSLAWSAKIKRNQAQNRAKCWQQLRYEFARQVGRDAGAEPLECLSVSRVGNPEETFEVNGRWYTQLTLYYYMRYAYVSRFIDFNQLNVCVELGSGSGKQAEVLHKLHPNMTLCLFDIPPQLYVCHQYLKAVFGSDIVSFTETQKMRDLSNLEPGKIYIFGNWKFPITNTATIDLFWNTASFAEMEPDVVENYLAIVNERTAHAYLMQLMRGKRVAKAEGKRGVLNATTFAHYETGLASFELLDRSVARWPDTRGSADGYEDSFWRRKE